MLGPVDDLVSSPSAYGLLGGAYALLSLPAALFPHAVRIISNTCPLAGHRGLEQRMWLDM